MRVQCLPENNKRNIIRIIMPKIKREEQWLRLNHYWSLFSHNKNFVYIFFLIIKYILYYLNYNGDFWITTFFTVFLFIYVLPPNKYSFTVLTHNRRMSLPSAFCISMGKKKYFVVNYKMIILMVHKLYFSSQLFLIVKKTLFGF
jgi:hypothetical protein